MSLEGWLSVESLVAHLTEAVARTTRRASEEALAGHPDEALILHGSSEALGALCHNLAAVGTTVRTKLVSSPPAVRSGIYREIEAERLRQNESHPETEDAPDGTGGGGRVTWRNIAQHSCDRATREGRLTYAHVLDEEQAEVLAETDVDKLEKELTQLAAVCVRWREKLERERNRRTAEEAPR